MLSTVASTDFTSPIHRSRATRDTACQDLQAALRWAASFFSDTLRVLPVCHPARVYLEARGLSMDAADHYKVGFAPDRWRGLFSAATRAGFPQDVLLEAGLIIPRQDGRGYFDRFRGRIIFPISDADGVPVGFSGRLVTGMQRLTRAQPFKYVNTPESPLFQKHALLFGLAQARSAIKQTGMCILVEGYTDVVALYQCGLTQSVALAGTILFEAQAHQLVRYARPAVLVLDGDEAGLHGARQALPLLLQRGIYPEIVVLQEGRDVADIACEKGRRGVVHLLRRRQSFTSFVLRQDQVAGRLEDAFDYAEAIRELLTLIRFCPDLQHRSGMLLRAFTESGQLVPRFAFQSATGEAHRFRAWCATMARL